MQPEEKESTEYDGIYFLPGQEDDEMVLSYFDFKNEMNYINSQKFNGKNENFACQCRMLSCCKGRWIG